MIDEHRRVAEFLLALSFNQNIRATCNSRQSLLLYLIMPNCSIVFYITPETIIVNNIFTIDSRGEKERYI